MSKITPPIFCGGALNWTVCFPNNKENWKIKNLENSGKVEHFYRLHYLYYVFDEKNLLIGDIMCFMPKCPELPHFPLHILFVLNWNIYLNISWPSSGSGLWWEYSFCISTPWCSPKRKTQDQKLHPWKDLLHLLTQLWLNSWS